MVVRDYRTEITQPSHSTIRVSVKHYKADLKQSTMPYILTYSILGLVMLDLQQFGFIVWKVIMLFALQLHMWIGFVFDLQARSRVALPVTLSLA